MSTNDSRLPRAKSTMTLRRIPSTAGPRVSSRMPAPTTRSTGLGLGPPARAGPSLSRKPSIQLRPPSTQMTRTIPATTSKPAATSAAVTKAVSRLMPARSMLQLPKVRARNSPKAQTVMQPSRRVVSTDHVSNVSATTNGQPSIPPQQLVPTRMTAPRPLRRVASAAGPSPLGPRASANTTPTAGTSTITVTDTDPHTKTASKHAPATPARKPQSRLLADTPLLPRLVSRPFPMISMEMLKDEEMSFDDSAFVSSSIPLLDHSSSQADSPGRSDSARRTSEHANSLRLAREAKEAAEKERDALRDEVDRLRRERTTEVWQRIVTQGQEAIRGEQELKALIELTRTMVLARQETR